MGSPTVPTSRRLCGVWEVMMTTFGESSCVECSGGMDLHGHPTEPNVRLLARAHRHCGAIYCVRSPILVRVGRP
jgi:hypothetical protein